MEIAWAAAEVAAEVVVPFISDLAVEAVYPGLLGGYAIAQGIGYLGQRFSGVNVGPSYTETIPFPITSGSDLPLFEGLGNYYYGFQPPNVIEDYMVSSGSKRKRRSRSSKKRSKAKANGQRSKSIKALKKHIKLMPKQNAPGHTYVSSSSDSGKRKRGGRKIKKLAKMIKAAQDYGPWKQVMVNSTGTYSSSQGLQNYSVNACGETGGNIVANCMYIDSITAANTIIKISISASPEAVVQYYLDKQLLLKNNHNYKVKIDIWDCFNKLSSALSPTDCLTAGIDSNTATGSVAYTAYGTTPKDAQPYLSQFYALKNHRMIELQPGEEIVINYRSTPKLFTYAMYVTESHNFFPGMHQWLIRQAGSLVHDNTTNTNVNISATTLDYLQLYRLVFRVRYSGDTKDFAYSSTYGTVTNADQIDPFANSLETTIGA